MVLNSVVLPEPLGPAMAMKSPGWIANSTPSRIVAAWYPSLAFRMLTKGSDSVTESLPETVDFAHKSAFLTFFHGGQQASEVIVDELDVGIRFRRSAGGLLQPHHGGPGLAGELARKAIALRTVNDNLSFLLLHTLGETQPNDWAWARCPA